jgi:beta-galactosidase
VREIEFRAGREGGFFLNGRRVPIKGVAAHQDFAGVGNALPDGVLRHRLERLREMGANTLRCAHYPQSPQLMELCDQLGLLVIAENRRHESASETNLADLEALVRRDRNHPSVILWNLENESGYAGCVRGTRVMTRMARLVRKLDPTRPCSAAINRPYDGAGYAGVFDVIGLNYWYESEKIHRAYDPVRVFLSLETACAFHTRGSYETDHERGHTSIYEAGKYRRIWRQDRTETAWRTFLENPGLTGLVLWCGFDFRGEPGPVGWPLVAAQYGLMDLAGLPKDTFHYIRSIWRDEPMVHVLPHWTLAAERIGEEIDVWVFSNAETVELLLNGRSLGERAFPRGEHLSWAVPYEPGCLRAVARRDGRVVAEHECRSAGAPARLALRLERREGVVDGRVIGIATVCVLDAHGVVVSIADNEVRFVVSAGARVLGTGNGDPSDHTPSGATRRRAFHGWCMAVIDPGEAPEAAGVEVVSPGLLGDRAGTVFRDARTRPSADKLVGTDTAGAAAV